MYPVAPYGATHYNPFAPTNFSKCSPSTSSLIPFAGAWQDFNHSLKAMEKEMWNMRSAIRNYDQEFGNDYTSTLANHVSRPANMIEHYSLMNPIRIDANGNRWINCYFDLRSFKPEEINVTLNTKERCINVEAHHEVKDAKDHYIKRAYSRKVFIPEDVKLDLSKVELKSCLTNEGLLCVEAPLPKLSIEEASKTSSKALASGTAGTVYPINVKKI